jgi:hypothetical protein
MTVPRASKLLLIWQPSFSLVPADNAWDARSLPARSTKFCTERNNAHYYFDTKKKLQHILLDVLTALATSVVDLSFPRNSRAELSTVWINTYRFQGKAYFHAIDQRKQVEDKPISVSDEIWSFFHLKRSPLSFFELLQSHSAQMRLQISASYNNLRHSKKPMLHLRIQK